MLDSKELQYHYMKFYVEMRRYMWDVQTVEFLVDFEIAVFQTIPSIERIQASWEKLKSAIRETLKSDEEFNKRANKLDSLIDSAEGSTYCELYKIREVPTA